MCWLLTETCRRNCRCWFVSKKISYLSLPIFFFNFLAIFYVLAHANSCYCLLCVEIFTEKLKTVRELLLLSCWYIMLWLCVSILIPGCSLPEMRPHYCNPVYCQYWVGQTPESGIELLPRVVFCRAVLAVSAFASTEMGKWEGRHAHGEWLALYLPNTAGGPKPGRKTWMPKRVFHR